MLCRDERRGFIIAEIEAGNGNGTFRAPVADAEIAIFAFVEFCAGGHEAKTARPAHSEIVNGKIRGFTQVRVPAFARAYEENAVAGVFNHVAAIMKTKSEFVCAGRGSGKDDVQVVVAVSVAFLRAHAFILKKDEWLAAFVRDAVEGESACELKNDYAVGADFRADADIRD